MLSSRPGVLWRRSKPWKHRVNGPGSIRFTQPRSAIESVNYWRYSRRSSAMARWHLKWPNGNWLPRWRLDKCNKRNHSRCRWHLTTLSRELVQDHYLWNHLPVRRAVWMEFLLRIERQYLLSHLSLSIRSIYQTNRSVLPFRWNRRLWVSQESILYFCLESVYYSPRAGIIATIFIASMFIS